MSGAGPGDEGSSGDRRPPGTGEPAAPQATRIVVDGVEYERLVFRTHWVQPGEDLPGSPGSTSGGTDVTQRRLRAILRDNPLGQRAQRTPIGLVRELGGTDR